MTIAEKTDWFFEQPGLAEMWLGHRLEKIDAFRGLSRFDKLKKKLAENESSLRALPAVPPKQTIDDELRARGFGHRRDTLSYSLHKISERMHSRHGQQIRLLRSQIGNCERLKREFMDNFVRLPEGFEPERIVNRLFFYSQQDKTLCLCLEKQEESSYFVQNVGPIFNTDVYVIRNDNTLVALMDREHVLIRFLRYKPVIMESMVPAGITGLLPVQDMPQRSLLGEMRVALV